MMIKKIYTLYKRSSLLARFSVLALIIVTAVGVVVALVLQGLLVKNTIVQESHNAADQVETVLDNTLTPSDLAAPPDPARLEQLDSFIRQQINSGHIVRIVIHNRAGQIVYSDYRELVGNSPPVDEKLTEALDGKVVADIATPAEEHFHDTGQYDRVIEVLAPIRIDGSDEVLGVYEIYHDTTVVDTQIATMRLYVGLSLGLGLVVLYLALFGIVRSASRKLVRSSKENLMLFEHERDRRSELATLYEISRELATVAPKSDETLGIIVHRAAETIHSTFVRALLIEDGNVAGCATYPVRDDIPNMNYHPTQVSGLPFLQQVLERVETVVLTRDDATGLTEDERKALIFNVAKTVCLVPIRTDGQAMGVLIIGEMRSENREPFTPEKISLARSIADQTAAALQRAQLFSNLEHSYLETVLSLANAVEAKDNYTKNHADNVSRMAVLVGKKLGLPEGELEEIRYGSILHDVGKIGIPDFILNKTGRLTDEEWEQMRAHAAIGADILKPVPHLAGAADIVRHHHERFDGNGYPDGLCGEDIPTGARILAVVDSYSTMIDRRSYKEARTHEDALAELKRCAGSQYDPEVVAAFVSLFELRMIIPREGETHIAKDEPPAFAKAV